MGMRTTLFTLTLMLATVALAAADERLTFADGLWRRGLYPQAAAEYEAFLKAPKGDATDAQFRLAECYEAMGRAGDARALYQKVAEATDGDRRVAAQLRIAVSLLEGGDAKGAQPLLETLATSRASEALRDAASYRLGVCYEALGRGQDAVTLYRLLLKPGNTYAAYARLRLADILGKQGKTAEALKLCDELLADAEAKDRHVAAGTLAFGLAYAAKDFATAAKYARTLGEKELGKAGLLLPATWAALKADAPSDARAWLAAEKLQNPNPTDGRLWLEGSIAQALKDEAGALTAYERILAEFPESDHTTAAAESMLILRAKAGNPEDFLRHATRVAQKLSPKTRLTLAPFILDAAVQTRNRVAAGEAAAILMEQGEPEQAAEAAYRLAWLIRQEGDVAAAGEAWLSAAERWPQTKTAGRAAYAAAYAFGQAKLADRAEVALRLALASGDPQVVPDALMLRARAELAEHDAASAATTLDEFLLRFPNAQAAAEAFYLRGLIFFNAKDFIAAEQTLAKALSAGTTEGAGPTPLGHARRTDAALRRAQSLHALNRGDEAAELLQPLVGLKDVEDIDPAYLRWLADFRLARQEWELAETTARALASKSTLPADRVLAQTLLGRAAEGCGQTATAIAAYEAALEAAAAEPTSHDAEAALRLGLLRAAEGSHERAVTALSLAAERADNATAEGRRQKAQAYSKLIDVTAALNQKDQALRAAMNLIIFFDDPELVPTAFDRAVAILTEQGRTAEAENLRAERVQRYGQPTP